ncbi:2-C-methyl-D-erythritol 2,4-cyclodiphosphate synthase [Desulfurispira natronophila]|uniref:2-C-methyl-D-erythritol 2,4-cyclodiphosphate synthase n=1 Tax=Desulfurispira natronophila TaxID=682562 RepID=A0A7W7Y480_9BACT|nr:2-C-methyl-D-erythritol 2,4-cyclodiphosphate synthase [Desulfurispira natronophila]MBB5021639.1 2-C-methyl-D-erythritol 2,4-cyclodiphosphate synthase [Desulfurispira natronophila]
MFRVGSGFDVHRFAPQRPLVLGGVTIEHSHGLLGHSDADVLLHAICDALLGAAALGDIGTHFPDTDAKYRGADSRHLLQQVEAKLAEGGWSVVNVDATIIAQEPRMAPHIDAMRRYIAQDLRTELSAISVKATTTEHLGFAGRKEGIAAQAVTMIKESP